MILDFKEIPQANTGNGDQDTFELFTRDFLSFLGYRICENPDRGADGGKDMIVEEVIKGITSEITIKWLVSCKHNAHGGKSISPNQETDINDRLKQHKCEGFMGVYSTLPSSGFSGKLKGVNKHEIFDHAKIEGFLLDGGLKGHRLSRRYFPESFKKYQIENPSPVQLFSDQKSIYCAHCGKDLLLEGEHGNYMCIKESTSLNEDKYTKIYFACKHSCDLILEKKRHNNAFKGLVWRGIDDLCHPTLWLRRLVEFINDIYKNQDLDDNAFEQMKDMFLCTYPYVIRPLTSTEKVRQNNLILGGFLQHYGN